MRGRMRAAPEGLHEGCVRGCGAGLDPSCEEQCEARAGRRLRTAGGQLKGLGAAKRVYQRCRTACERAEEEDDG
jgi:hypothetical protein